jgi:hypothetical protein
LVNAEQIAIALLPCPVIAIALLPIAIALLPCPVIAIAFLPIAIALLPCLVIAIALLSCPGIEYINTGGLSYDGLGATYGLCVLKCEFQQR